MQAEQLGYLIGLIRIAGSDGPRIGRLISPHADRRGVGTTWMTRLLLSGITPRRSSELKNRLNEVDPDREIALLKKEDITAIAWDDERYPPLLQQCPDPPPVLFVRGALSSLTGMPTIAVVGTRKVTTYGLHACRRIVHPLAAAGACVVSGLAFGVDAAAHETALESDGLTAAVLASGIDDANISPKSHYRLALRIIEGGGALISERPPSSAPTKRDFPIRNRIIAGLSMGTVVLEAARRSGALITARAALEYDRDVFALPGPIFSEVSHGTNTIISEGAIPVTSEKTLPEHFGLSRETRSVAAPDLTETESLVLTSIAAGPLTTDEITEKTGLPVGLVSGAISGLEMKGLSRLTAGGKTEIIDSHPMH